MKVLDRLIDAVDEAAHRHGLVSVNGHSFGVWKFTPFVWLCNLRDRRLWAAALEDDPQQ